MYRVTNLQWPLVRAHGYPGFIPRSSGRSAWYRNRRDSLCEIAYLLACLSQPFASHIHATHIYSDLCQCTLYFFKFALSLSTCLVKNLHALLLELVAILFELLALVLSLGTLHTHVETLVL